MDKKNLAIKILQTAAACYGILGVGLVLAGILFVIPQVKNNIWGVFLIFPVLTPGILLLLVAYQNIKKFGLKSIRSFSAILAITISIFVTSWLMPFIKEIPISSERYDVINFILAPMVIALAVYSILCKQLIKLAKGDN